MADATYGGRRLTLAHLALGQRALDVAEARGFVVTYFGVNGAGVDLMTYPTLDDAAGYECLLALGGVEFDAPRQLPGSPPIRTIHCQTGDGITVHLFLEPANEEDVPAGASPADQPLPLEADRG